MTTRPMVLPAIATSRDDIIYEVASRTLIGGNRAYCLTPTAVIVVLLIVEGHTNYKYLTVHIKPF